MNDAQLLAANVAAGIQVLQGCKVSAAYLHLYAMHKAQNPTPPEEPPFVPCYPIEAGPFYANDGGSDLDPAIEREKRRLFFKYGTGVI